MVWSRHFGFGVVSRRVVVESCYDIYVIVQSIRVIECYSRG